MLYAVHAVLSLSGLCEIEPIGNGVKELSNTPEFNIFTVSSLTFG